MALSIIGGLIWLMGFIATITGQKEPLDLLGFGLIGTPGLMIYLAILAAIGAAGFFVYQAVRRGKLWVRPVERLVYRIPKLGSALETLALARLAWTLQVTLEAGMDLQPAFRLALASTRASHFTERADDVARDLRSGREVYEILSDTRLFPHDFLDAVQVGEHSGRLAETLAVLSTQYQDRARSALGVLTQVAGFAVWAMVAGLIIVIIFRLFGFYVDQIKALT